jgi:hypothetical protein
MNLAYITHLLVLASAIKAFPLGDQSQHPGSHLDWAPCELEGLDHDLIHVPIDCAKLAVPLDYTDPHGSEELQLQLLKVNATKEPVLGSVLLNPGGPGSSGVEDVAEKGHIYDE